MANAHRGGYMARVMPRNGLVAPEIVLPAGRAQAWALHDFRGKVVVLVFYPADWEPVSMDQLKQYNEALPQIEALGAELVGISVDGVWSHRAFARGLRLRFPLLSDAHPHGAAALAYGVYRARDGMSERALVVVDPTGIIRLRALVPREINPGIDGMLTALEELAGLS